MSPRRPGADRDGLPSVVGQGRWRHLLALVANGAAQAAAAVVVAGATEAGFDRLGGPLDPWAVAAVAGALLLATAALAHLRARERVVAERLGQAYVHEVRLGLYDRLAATSARRLHHVANGSIGLRFVGDLSTLRRWVSLGLARLVVAGTTVLTTLTVLWLVEPTLAVVSGLAVAAGAAVAFIQAPALRGAEREARRRRSRLAGRMTELVASVAVVQANGAVDRERRRVRRLSRRLEAAMIDRAQHLGRLTALAESTTGVASGGVLVAGLVSGLAAPRVAGAMVIVGLLVPQLRGLARVHEYHQGARVAGDAIDRFHRRPTGLDRSDTLVPLPDGPGSVSLCDAGLDGIVDGLSADIPGGATVAVVGPNGAGKSTLLSLLGRLADPTSGAVLLDGVDLRRLDDDDLRAAVAMAGPDLPLLRGSLHRNLTYRCRNADAEAVTDVLARCDLLPFVFGLADGLDTRVGEQGLTLSSGQRQRVQLARALLGRPRLLLLDEADANLDPATSAVVRRVVAERTETTVVVTHRLETVLTADIVWHLDGGRLIEVGAPGPLLAGDGPTAVLFGAAEAPRTRARAR